MGGPPALLGMCVLAEAPLLSLLVHHGKALKRTGVCMKPPGLHCSRPRAVEVLVVCAVAAVGGCFGSGDVLQRRWGCLKSLKRPPGPFYPIKARQGRGWWSVGAIFP